MKDPQGPYGAVLIVRIWFELHPSHSTLRARIIHSDDPTRAEADSIVVAGTERTVHTIRDWLNGYVAAVRDQADGRP